MVKEIAVNRFEETNTSIPVRIKNKTHYRYENGLIYVDPYFKHLKTYAKGRWEQQAIGDVFEKEFKNYTKEIIVSTISQLTI